jgi:myo-inositol-1(or 4)-monophosphatase
MTEAAEDIDVSELEEIERIAVELATLAGAEIQAALGSMIAVRYKGESPDKTLWRDPVSEIDQRVETLIRSRVAERFPGHDVMNQSGHLPPELTIQICAGMSFLNSPPRGRSYTE